MVGHEQDSNLRPMEYESTVQPTEISRQYWFLNFCSNFYELLGIERGATKDEIERAYKKKSTQVLYTISRAAVLCILVREFRLFPYDNEFWIEKNRIFVFLLKDGGGVFSTLPANRGGLQNTGQS